MRSDAEIVRDALVRFSEIDPEYRSQVITECDRLIDDRTTDPMIRQNLINWRYKRLYAPVNRPSAA